MSAMISYMKELLASFHKDESGATMIEYSLLIGLITALVVAAVIAIGGWAGAQWNALRAALGV